MPRIEADFTQISSSFEPVPADVYICTLKKIETEETKGGGGNKNILMTFELEIDDPSKPDFKGRNLFDRVYLLKKNGEPNKVSYGRVKQYAEATIGTEAANNPSGYDTDEFLNSSVLAQVELDSYDYIPSEFDSLPDGPEKEAKRKKGSSNKIARILPVT